MRRRHRKYWFGTMTAAMKLLLVVVAVLVGVCASSPVPQVPGDNTHYVEGESRYIWMSDDQGKPILVDLHEPVNESLHNSRNGALNRYYLYSRQNPNNPREIIHNNANTINAAGFVSSRPLVVLVHGWTGSMHHPMNPDITSNLLAVQDCNVIVVDWRETASMSYSNSVNAVPGVGQHLGNFLTWLINTSGTNWNNVHLVGFSLGAHVVGNAGRTTGNRPRRVTALDPAGPLWLTNNQRLRASDGQYVEAIHTDAFRQGIGIPVAVADFFPNGGGHDGSQPGCSHSLCNHDRAPQLFAATVRYNHLNGRRCSDVNQAANNACYGLLAQMGNNILSKRANGIYGLRTGANWAY